MLAADIGVVKVREVRRAVNGERQETHWIGRDVVPDDGQVVLLARPHDASMNVTLAWVDERLPGRIGLLGMRSAPSSA